MDDLHKQTQLPHARGALAGNAADSVIDVAHRHEIAAAELLGRSLSIADIAHALGLAETGIVEQVEISEFVRGLLELHDGDGIQWDPGVGDAFSNREQALVAVVGSSAAGWLSAGRPRREALRVALRLHSRREVRALQQALIGCIEAITASARPLVSTPMIDYTYLQHAQPTTLAHTMSGWACALLRDVDRLERCAEWLECSVAGSGGTAGSRWPISRSTLAQLLGHDVVALNTRDAMWQWDGYVEILSAIAICLTGISQLAQDFEIYCSSEFGMLELSDAHSRESALMPNKRNPYALVSLRMQAGRAAGDVSAALTTLHSGSARTDHFQLLNVVVPQALRDATATVTLFADVLQGCTWNTERIESIVTEHSRAATSADLADVIAQSTDLDYRSAHTLVAHHVQRTDHDSISDGQAAAAIDADAERLFGTSPGITAEMVADARDMQRAITSRSQPGMCSTGSVQAILDTCATSVNVHRELLASAVSKIVAAEEELIQTARYVVMRTEAS